MSLIDTHWLVKADRKVFGAGETLYGALASELDGPDLLALTELRGMPDRVAAKQIAAGPYHSIVLGSDGKVYGTGENRYGALTTLGEDVRRLTLLPQQPPGRTVAVSAGSFSTYVVTEDRAVYGAGNGGPGGSLTTGAKREQRTFHRLRGLPSDVRALSVVGGPGSAVVVGDDGIAYGTGWNPRSSLTGYDFEPKLSPMAGLPEGVRAVAASLNGDHSLVLGDNGIAYSAGDNLWGPGTLTVLTPVPGLPSGVRAVDVASDRTMLSCSVVTESPTESA